MDVQAMLLRAACTGILLGILVAGLWPFHAPRNDVTWGSEGNGLLFGKHGSIVSAGPLHARSTPGDNSCSLEVWLQPSRIDSGGMILAFYDTESRNVPFALRQFRSGLVLKGESKDSAVKKIEIYVGDVFRGSKPALVTITSGEAGTAVYVDGTLVKRVSNFAVSNRDLSGQLVVGNGPSMTYNWSGRVKGLAVYDHEFSAAEVSQSLVTWTNGAQLDSTKNRGVVARYLFDEGSGGIVHNRVDSATHLLIPERFFVLHAQFLERPWDEFRTSWSYLKDVGINVVGFIPLGLFFYAYFSQVKKVEHAAAFTIALGFAVSLTIEVLQSFLPTRDSGMTDLITNTFGTAVGVMAFRLPAAQAVLAALSFRAAKTRVSA